MFGVEFFTDESSGHVCAAAIYIKFQHTGERGVYIDTSFRKDAVGHRIQPHALYWRVFVAAAIILRVSPDFRFLLQTAGVKIIERKNIIKAFHSDSTSARRRTRTTCSTLPVPDEGAVPDR